VFDNSKETEADGGTSVVVVVRKEDIVLLRNLYACNVLFACVCSHDIPQQPIHSGVRLYSGALFMIGKG